MTILDSSHHTTPASREEMCQMDNENRGRASLATQSLPSHAPTQGRRERLLGGKTAQGDPHHGPTWAHPPQPPDREQKRAGREGKGVQAEGISPALSDVYTVCSRSPGWLEQGD